MTIIEGGRPASEQQFVRFALADGSVQDHEVPLGVPGVTSFPFPEGCTGVEIVTVGAGGGVSVDGSGAAGGGSAIEVYAVGPRERRELCEEDDGLRKCCGTAQLGPHDAECPKSPAMQEAIRCHELMYRHATEVAQ